jgi:hypothetical protein
MSRDSKIWIYVKEKFKANSVARRLQAKEYERRLAALNHEAARLSLMIPKEHFDIVVNQMKSEIKVIQLWISNQEGKAARSQLIAIVSILVSIAAIVLSFFRV